MSRLVLPQKEELKAFGGRPCFAPLLDVVNDGDAAVRLEVRVGEAETWQTLLPSVPPQTAWAATRATPLWLPRVASVRLVRNDTGAEVWQRVCWGEGGFVRVAGVSSKA